jgi:hypothetical protein
MFNGFSEVTRELHENFLDSVHLFRFYTALEKLIGIVTGNLIKADCTSHVALEIPSAAPQRL